MSADLVFSCPSCRRPLVVEPAAAGTRITCPLCQNGVRVPEVRRAVALMRERLEVLDRHMVSVAYRRTPSDTVQIPETWTPVPKQTLWKPLTIGFGTLAFVLALLLSFWAG
jgi:LSD1 subclass zinc finger protein